jgi:hypothetical protein
VRRPAPTSTATFVVLTGIAAPAAASRAYSGARLVGTSFA